ncbi:MAG: hypothetical protein ABR991_03935 [Terracidiphilus sp.]|jgi:hypothetical protein
MQQTAAIGSEKLKASRWNAWFSVIGATFGMLAGVVIALNLLAITLRLSEPAHASAHTRTAPALAMLFASGSGAGEFLFLIFLWLILRI